MTQYRVWIDQDLCTGDGLCAEIAPKVFFMHDDGLAYVKEDAEFYGETKELDKDGQPCYKMSQGLARIPDSLFESVVESAEECPGECIFIEEVED
jgi:ferredoxin